MDRRSALAGLAGFALTGCSRSVARKPSPLPSPSTLDADHQPLRGFFEREIGAARVLVLASPT